MSDIKILLVDDDAGILELLSTYFRNQGFDVAEAASIAEFKTRLTEYAPDLVVLDIMLPDGSGLHACRELRQAGVKTPIILATAVTEEVDRILGLEFGADDYVGKPFNPRELVARIRAVLRRVGDVPHAEEERTGTFRFAGFTCDPAQRGLTSPQGDDVPLTGAEFDLLMVFLERPQRLIQREKILELTGKGVDTFDTSINVLISRLRKKLSIAGASDELFRTVRNGGYQLTSKVERN